LTVYVINNDFICSRVVGIELDAQVSTTYTSREEEQWVDGRTFRHGLGSRRVQDVRVSGNDVYGRHSVPEPIGE